MTEEEEEEEQEHENKRIRPRERALGQKNVLSSLSEAAYLSNLQRNFHENKLTKAAVEKNSIPPFEFEILTLTPLFFNHSH